MKKGEWLRQEDRDFHNLQMSTNCRAGYCTTIEDTQGVHPRINKESVKILLMK